MRYPRLIALVLVLLIPHAAFADAKAKKGASKDPNLANPTEVVTAKLDGYTIAGLVTHLEGARTFKYAIALFPGHPGILKLREEDGRPRFDLPGNFVVRTRRHWLDNETLVVVVDAPSDQWASFDQRFRESARYGADVGALLKEVGSRYSVQDWTFVGTSEGSISAFHAARMNPALARRVILTSSIFQATRTGPALSGVDFGELKSELLWVHHADDPCRSTPYRDAVAFAKKTNKPLVTVRGGGEGARGGACEAHSAHGYVGIERPVVKAMQSWVKTGTVPADVE